MYMWPGIWNVGLVMSAAATQQIIMDSTTSISRVIMKVMKNGRLYFPI